MDDKLKDIIETLKGKKTPKKNLKETFGDFLDRIEEVENFRGEHGEKGEPGYTPIKGVDYFDGEPGYTPQKGIDYFDGKDADEVKIVSKVLAKIPTPKDGKDADSGIIAQEVIKTLNLPDFKPLEPAELRDKLSILKGNDRLDISAIKGAEYFVKLGGQSTVGKKINTLDERWHGGGNALQILDEGISLTTSTTSIDFVGDGVTATAVGNAVTVTIPSTDLSGYFKLDQTTRQTVENGVPMFDAGLEIAPNAPIFFTNYLVGDDSIRFDGTNMEMKSQGLYDFTLSDGIKIGDYTFSNSSGISTASGGFVANGFAGMTLQHSGSNILVGTGTATELSYNSASFLRGDAAGTKLTALTSNGFVKTSGGTGLLSIDTNTYLTSSTATLQVVTTAGATSNQAITLTSASPQLTLGVQSVTAGGIKFWDNDSANSVTLQPAKHSTASYTLQFPDTTAGTKEVIIASSSIGASYVAFGGASALLTGDKNFSYASGVATLGSAGVDGALVLYSDQVGTDYTATLRANTAMTASATYYFPTDHPASVTQLMKMTTGGVMEFQAGTAFRLPVYTATNTFGELASVGSTGNYLRANTGAIPSWSTLTLPDTGTANRLLAFTATNQAGEVNAPGLTGSYLRGTIGSMPDWSTLVLPNNGTAYTLPVFTGTDTLGELTSVGTTGQILKGNTGAIPSWSDDLILVGKTTTYNNVATAGYGTPAIVDYVALTGQTADIGSTNFTNAGTAGLYRINYYLECTTSDATAGAVNLTISFADDAGAATIVSANLPLTTTATRIQSSLTSAKQLAQLNSGSISYSTAHTGIFGSAVFALYISVERLN